MPFLILYIHVEQYYHIEVLPIYSLLQSHTQFSILLCILYVMRKSSVQNIQEVAEVLSAAMATEKMFSSGPTIITISRMLPPLVILSIYDFLLDI